MNQDSFAPNPDFGSAPPSLGGTPPPNYSGTDPQGFSPTGNVGTNHSGSSALVYTAPDPGGLPSQTPKSSGMSAASKLKAGVVVGVLGIAGFGAYASRNEVSVEKVEVGHCLVDPGFGVLTSVTKIDCNEPHELEVYALVNLEQSADEGWPGPKVVEDRAVDECVSRVEDFIGEDFMASVYDVTFITPVQSGWDDGDREGICAVLNVDGSQLMGPVNS